MLAITLAALVLAIGLGTAVYLYVRPEPWSKTIVAIVVLALATLGIGFGTYPIALHIAQASAVGGYHQFLNGSVVSADSQAYTCTRDGICDHTYLCDPYLVPITTYYTDGKGHTHSETTWVTRYHSCPYATQEYTYTLSDSLGTTYTIASHIFAANPQQWRPGSGLPDVPRGIPAAWQQAKDHLSTGNADPVTVPSTYNNYILASEKTILRVSSDDINLLKSKSLLPDHTQDLQNPIHDIFRANKVSFVGGPTVSNQAAWQNALMHFDAALGMQKQGDMHLVVIKASALPASVSPEDYANALKAYWLNNLGKYALAKNGIMLVLAVNDSGSTIVWSRAATGMPIGNGAMLEALGTELTGKPFTVDTVFGNTTARISTMGGKLKPVYTLGSGLVPQIVMVRFPFQRACMGCTGANEVGEQGFVNLSTEIPLGGWGTFWAIFVDVFIVFIVWGAAFVLYFAEEEKREQYLHHVRRLSGYNRLYRTTNRLFMS